MRREDRPRERGRPAPPPEDARVELRRAERPRPPAPAARQGAKPQGGLLARLASREGLRTVILAREILGPPKALRRPEDDL